MSEMSTHYLQTWTLLLLLVSSIVFADPKYMINLYAGLCSGSSCTGGYNSGNGPSTSTAIYGPCGMAITSDGTLYWADYKNHVIRKVINGYITTIAGVIGSAGDGTSVVPTSCKLNVPQDVFVDSSGAVYIADNGNHKIRVVYPGNTIVTIAGTGVSGFSGDGGPAVNAQLSFPRGIYVFNSKIYIADHGNHRIRMIYNGYIQTIAGNGQVGSDGDGGPAIFASLCYPTSVRVAPSGNVYISYFDHEVNAIRKVDTYGVISTVIQSSSRMVGQNFWVTDNERKIIMPNWFQNTISIYSYPQSVLTTIAGISGSTGYSGDGGDSLAAQLYWPYGAVVDNNSGTIYISDNFNNAIRTLIPNCGSGQLYNKTELDCFDVCFGVPSNLAHVCSGKGTCTAPNTCLCPSGWKGKGDCSESSCEALGNCNGHGICTGPNECTCQTGWKGSSDCSMFSCDGMNNCTDHGTCISNNLCACQSGWKGSEGCSKPSCEKLQNCSGHGTCKSNNTCDCHWGWKGSDCSVQESTNGGGNTVSVDNNNPTTPTGAIVGGVIGGVSLLGVLISFIFIVMIAWRKVRHVKKTKNSQQLTKTLTPPPLELPQSSSRRTSKTTAFFATPVTQNDEQTFTYSSISSAIFVSATHSNVDNCATPTNKENVLYSRYEGYYQFLGEGGFGKVYQVKLKGENVYRALKIISPTNGFDVNQGLQEAFQTVKLSSKHQNIVCVHCAFLLDNMDLCIEMDLMEYGSLHTMFCRKDSIVPSEEIIWSVISQMINVLSVISKEKIVHRDIKPDNILVKSVNLVSNEIHVCLTDFGLAKDLKCYMNQKSEIKGTMGFIAPEIFDSNNYSTASDIFALGVTIYQLMTGCQNDITALCKQPDALRKDILTNQRVTYSAELIDLVMRMVDTNMSTRITLPEMMK